MSHPNKKSAASKESKAESETKETAAKKTPARKTVTGKTGAKKTAAKKVAATKATTGKPAGKKSASKKAIRKKSAASKTPPTKKAGSKKTEAGKAAAKKKTVKGVGTKKTSTKKVAAKKAVTKKTKTAKSASKKATTKKTSAKKAVGKEGSPSKTTPTKKATTSAKKGAGKTSDKTEAEKAAVKKSLVQRSSSKKSAPIVFSLDEAEALVASRKKEGARKATAKKSKAGTPPPKKASTGKADVTAIEGKKEEKRVHAPASLSDILGYDPAQKGDKDTHLEEDDIPRKWKKYYRLLIEMRERMRKDLELHTADTLKHSSRDDSGDLSSYGSHQADAGTETFDRDFALTLVSNEHEALNEIENAIQRIKNGAYGTCEITGKPISKERLTAVPFARFSVEGQAEYERNKRRKVERHAGGIFGDTSDTPPITGSEEDREEE